MAIASAPEIHLRFHEPHAHLSAPFGSGGFGAVAERIARFFGTPQYLISQTLVVIAWIAANSAGIVGFDLYPFILLNLAFSTQAAYAAPLILLAQTKQAERDKMWSDADARHREELAQNTLTLLQQNTELTQQVATLSQQVHELTEQIHQHICRIVLARIIVTSGRVGIRTAKAPRRLECHRITSPCVLAEASAGRGSPGAAVVEVSA